MPNNEHDILLAIMNIGRADTGVGGLVQLTGKTVPIVKLFDLARADAEGVTPATHEPPVASVYFLPASQARGVSEMLRMDVQIDAYADPQTEGLEAQMMDRIEQILTGPNFTAEGLDVGVSKGNRTRIDEPESGRVRLTEEFTLLLRR